MPAKVILEVLTGPIQGRTFEFNAHDTFLFGRQADCHARLPTDDKFVSRHHFILEANPPDACVRDLGSRNGTYVNGTRYGGRTAHETREQAAARMHPQVDLKHGDQIVVGKTAIQVKVELPVVCGRCGTELAEPALATAAAVNGDPVCAACQQQPAPPRIESTITAMRCERCGKDVAGEMHPGRRGEYVCRACQTEVQAESGGLKKLIQAAAARHRSKTPEIAGYEIGEELGKGGMGAVYKAVRKSDGQTVAVKVMLAKIAVDDHARQMFLREIEVTRHLRHNHIVRLLDSGTAGSAFFCVLEYCGGGCLKSVAKRRQGRLSLTAAGPMMIQCLKGLDHAHRAGFVHRDLKPENILLQQVEGRWRTKITDFGLAKSFEQAGLSGMTATGRIGGTFHFMPREQLTNYKFVRPVSDLWSLAATFYKLLSGHVPLDFPPDRDPMEVVLGDEPVPLGAQRELPAGKIAPARTSPTDALHVRCAAASETGRVRAHNEDRWYADAEQQLYVVSDGMGGQAAGELASRIVVEILPERLREHLSDADELDEATVNGVMESVRRLSFDVRQESEGEPGLAGMGATLVLALIRGRQALIVHLGDSRAYLLRQGKLARLTSDHTLAHALWEAGMLTAQEAADHPGRHQLSRFVGMPGEPLPAAQRLRLLPADRLLLCSDGLTSMLPDEQIGGVLDNQADVERACQQLIACATTAGGKDNITALLLEFV